MGSKKNIFVHKPTAKQKQALRFLYNRETEFVVFGGGAGGGKSWIGCEWILAMCLNFPNVRYFIARNVLKRLKESTYKTFIKVAKHHGVDDLFTYSEQKALITFNNGSEVQLLELKRQPSDPLFEDLGSLEFTGGFIEEASEIDFDAYDTIKTRIGRQMNVEYNIPPKLFITCNPKKNWLYFEYYKPYRDNTLSEDKAFVQSLATDNPHTSSQYVETLKKIQNKAKRERLLLGNWEYDDNPYSLYDFEVLQDLFTNDYVEEGKKYISCDVARFGVDKTIIVVWSGFRAIEIVEMDLSKTTDVASKIKQLARKHKVPNRHIIVDEDGVGGGVVDIISCIGFLNGSKPIVNQNFANLKSECSFKLVDYLENMYLCCNETQRELIIQELEAIEEKNAEDENKKLSVNTREQVKAKIGRSPDYFSAIMMRMYFELKQPVTLRPFIADGTLPNQR
ncbi:MAG: phage terminase large subunit [Flavobacteriales bacterium]|nr:phage terminase large subunit [Flavobacteriales bacterium]